MVDIEVETHADRIGRDQILDVALLVEADLSIAGPRAERAENHCCPTTLAADQLGDRIDLVGGKRDNGGALRQAGDLLLPGIEELRHPRPLDDGDPGQQSLQDPAHGPGAKQKGLLAPAKMHDAVGEDMAAFQISSELNFVDGNKGSLRLARHRLDRADGKTGARRRDLLFTSDQGDGGRTHLLDHPGIDLARQKPQRQPDDTAAMGHHPFDGVVGLAGIGRAEHRGHAASAEHHGLKIQNCVRTSRLRRRARMAATV